MKVFQSFFFLSTGIYTPSWMSRWDRQSTGDGITRYVFFTRFCKLLFLSLVSYEESSVDNNDEMIRRWNYFRISNQLPHQTRMEIEACQKHVWRSSSLIMIHFMCPRCGGIPTRTRIPTNISTSLRRDRLSSSSHRHMENLFKNIQKRKKKIWSKYIFKNLDFFYFHFIAALTRLVALGESRSNEIDETYYNFLKVVLDFVLLVLVWFLRFVKIWFKRNFSRLRVDWNFLISCVLFMLRHDSFHVPCRECIELWRASGGNLANHKITYEREESLTREWYWNIESDTRYSTNVGKLRNNYPT